MLIVGCGYSKISFHFCNDCRIFCEGIKDDPAITMANYANSKLQLIVEGLFLPRGEDKSETMTSSLLLFCVKDAPASMMATHAKLKLQLIVASIRRALNARSTTSIQENNFQLIVEHLIPHSEGEYIYSLDHEGVRATPHYSGQLIVHSIVSGISKPTQMIVESKYSKRFLHFREDCGIFCEGEWVFGHNLAFGRNLGFGLVNLVGFIGVGLIVSLIGRLDSLGGLIGHISLVGRCIIGASVASAALWAESALLASLDSTASSASLAKLASLAS